MMLYAQRVIGLSVLSIDLEGKGQDLSTALSAVLPALEARINSAINLPLWVPTPNTRTIHHAKHVLDEFIYRLIDVRRREHAQGEKPGRDVLDVLMETVDEETGEKLSDEDLRDDVLTMFIAGHETTANLLTWTFLMLARNREQKLQERIIEELKTTPLESVGRASNTLLDRTVSESLRIRPPAWVVDRVASEDCTLGDIPVGAGEMVLINIWALHHNPSLWPEPERFDPDRFLEKEVAKRHKFSYLPFLAGNRKCVGDMFSLAEAKIALATWLPSVVVHPTTTEIAEEMAVTLRPRGGMPSTIAAI